MQRTYLWMKGRIQTRSLQFMMGMVVRSKRFSVIEVFFSSCFVGDTVSKFSGINVHKRLVAAKAYSEKRYEEALKRAFLGTDEDFLAGYFIPSYPLDFPHLNHKPL
jgi:hypothetical protein